MFLLKLILLIILVILQNTSVKSNYENHKTMDTKVNIKPNKEENISMEKSGQKYFTKNWGNISHDKLVTSAEDFGTGFLNTRNLPSHILSNISLPNQTISRINVNDHRQSIGEKNIGYNNHFRAVYKEESPPQMAPTDRNSSPYVLINSSVISSNINTSTNGAPIIISKPLVATLSLFPTALTPYSAKAKSNSVANILASPSIFKYTSRKSNYKFLNNPNRSFKIPVTLPSIFKYTSRLSNHQFLENPKRSFMIPEISPSIFKRTSRKSNHKFLENPNRFFVIPKMAISSSSFYSKTPRCLTCAFFIIFILSGLIPKPNRMIHGTTVYRSNKPPLVILSSWLLLFLISSLPYDWITGQIPQSPYCVLNSIETTLTERLLKSFELIINGLPGDDVPLPGYNYCGPGNKLKENLKKNVTAVNPLDEACKEHEIAYISYDLGIRHNADLILADKAWDRVYAEDASANEKSLAWKIAKYIKSKLKINC